MDKKNEYLLKIVVVGIPEKPIENMIHRFTKQNPDHLGLSVRTKKIQIDDNNVKLILISLNIFLVFCLREASSMNISVEQRDFLQKLLNFFLVSCGGLIVNTLTFSVTLYGVPELLPVYPLLLDLTLPSRFWEFASVSFAILITTLWNFCLNKLWTFRSQDQYKRIMIQTTQYMLVGAIGAVENLSFYAFLTILLSVDPIPAVISSFLVSVFSNFLLNNYWTFAERGSAN